MRFILLAAFTLLAGAAHASDGAILPPLRAWSGDSEKLALDSEHPWAAPVEKTGFQTTPTLEGIDAWYGRLSSATPSVRYLTAGHSPEGRPIRLVVVSREGASTPEELQRNGRPTILAQGGIHAGEIDGSDAGMMLIRDLTVTGKLEGLLDRVNLLLIPVLNVDGHARASRYGRINQRGPETMGWRTNAANLNLNRDYAKLDTAEVRTVLDVIRRWNPLLYLDLHVTDGSDYQYDITWGWNGSHAWSPAISQWIDQNLRPHVDGALTRAGHAPGRLVFESDARFPEMGLVEWTAPTRFSNGWGDAAHVPTILVENHSLKPFRRRVLGTRVLLQAVLEAIASAHAGLTGAVSTDVTARRSPVPLDWAQSDDEAPRFEFPAYATRTYLSAVTGDVVVEFLEEPKTWNVPLLRETKVTASAERPAAYWVPPAWPEVVERIEAHGIGFERISQPRTVDVEMYRLEAPQLSPTPLEGRVTLTTDWTVEQRRETYPAGSLRIPTDQPLGTLAMLLLEPGSPDSFLRWGFFNSILTRTEYTEAYVMEPMARRMLEENPRLAEEFEEALVADEALRKDPQRRLLWFYERTPYFDARWNLYPVGRE